jgi:hypothetical protein
MLSMPREVATGVNIMFNSYNVIKCLWSNISNPIYSLNNCNKQSTDDRNNLVMCNKWYSCLNLIKLYLTTNIMKKKIGCSESLISFSDSNNC